MLKKNLIIFDFDGVLADSMDLAVSVLNVVGAKYKLSGITLEDVKQIGVSGLIKKYNISSLLLPFLIREARIEISKRIDLVKPIKGIEHVLKKLSKNFQLGILTSNTEKNVSTFLKKNTWKDLFAFIVAGSSIFGKDKVLKKIVKEKGIDISRVVYVGDETRDIQAANKLNIPIISVTWGYESINLLKPLSPDYIAKKPADLLKIALTFSK